MTTKKELVLMCKTLGITNISNKNKTQLKELIKNYSDNKMIKIIASGKVIKYVYHSADIHIRTLDRHTEYYKVFDNLYDKLNEHCNLEESVFVICGDIFHNRDKLVSETIVLFNYLITKLSSIIDVIIIAGNHDTFTHTDRMDTISGITFIKNYPNCYYLKETSIYKYHNIDFVVSSLVDSKFIRSSELPLKTENVYRIALYHGTVSGSKLDNEVILRDQLLNIGDFKGYSYVLLGDIHKRQFLTDTIAYPGSLIQQNHKEEIDHGILKWDLINKSSEFIKIENDYSYITLYIKENNHFDETIKFTKKSRIKIIHDYSTNIDIDIIKKKLHKLTEIISITKEITCNNMIDNKIKEETISREILDKKIFTNMINKYTTEMQNKLVNIHTKYSNSIEENHIASCIWQILNIEFSNVYIYGDNYINKIDFTDKNGIIGILGSNAMGKTSIFNIILYALFGNITKNKSYINRNIINKNSKNFKIKLQISMNNNVYTIERSGKNKTRTNGSKSMDEILTFKMTTENNIETDLTDTSKIITNEKIKNTFGLISKDTFSLTNVMSYSNYISILNMTSSDISNIFNKIFNLECYSIIHSKVLKEYKTITDKIKFKQGQLDSMLLQKKDCLTDNELIELKDKIDNNKEKLNIISMKLGEYNSKKKEQVNLSEELLSKLLPENKLMINKSELKDCIIEKLNYLTKPILTLKEIDIKLSTLKNKKLFETNENIEDLIKQRNELENNYSTNLMKPCTEKEYIKANDYIYNFLGYMDTSYLIKELHELQPNSNEEFTVSSVQYTNILITLNTLGDIDLLTEYTNYKIIIKNYLEYKEKIKKNKEIENDLDVINNKINYIEYNNLINSKKYLELELLLNKIEDYLDNIDLNKEKELILNEKIILEKKIENDTNNYIEMKLNIKQQNTILETIVNYSKELTILEKDEQMYKIYKNIISDKSLPKLILNNTIKKVEEETNILIYNLAGLQIQIDTSEDSKWDILIKKGNILLGTEQISGYERFIINIGLKIALDKYKFYSGTKIFFIDEAFDCVAEDNFDNIDKLFIFLKKYYYNILIISHNEELKKKIDYRIDIDSDFTTSKIKNNM